MARINVVMPKMGESVMEGTVLSWFKKPGDAIGLDETLLEIGTDKVDSEIPSPAAGTVLEIVVPEGDTVLVGTVLAILETESVGDAAAPADPAPQPEVENALSPAPVPEPVSTPTPVSQPASTPAASDLIDVVMPKMGESVMEGTVLSWSKQPGDPIELDETLLEIGTDKVDSEIPSPAAGTIAEVLVPEGETVEVGTVLARIAGTGVAVLMENAPVNALAAAETLTENPPAKHGTDGRFYSPLVRSIAGKEGVSSNELTAIPGSGRDGRVTKSDILAYVDVRSTSPTTRVVPEVAPGVVAPASGPGVAPAPPPAPAVSVEAGDRVEIIEMDRMRQVIADHMTRSLATSAHVTSFAEADVTNLVRLRDANKVAFQEREGVRLTYTPFFVKASVDALRNHPIMNASIDGRRVIVKKDFHVGIAVAIEKAGLVVPVIRYAGGMNVAGLAHTAADLAVRARNKKLQPDELQGGTFTVTNVGSLGSLMGTPIINQPQVAILATGAITKRAVVIEHPDLGDVIAVRSMVYLSLSYDHRIIDGAMAASFLRNLVSNLEEMGPGYDL